LLGVRAVVRVEFARRPNRGGCLEASRFQRVAFFRFLHEGTVNPVLVPSDKTTTTRPRLAGSL
jgi:hypothetical protein